METLTKDIFREKVAAAFEKQQFSGTWNMDSFPLRREALEFFLLKGLPNMKVEEWKYTSLKKVFNSAYTNDACAVLPKDFTLFELPSNAVRLVYLNGVFQPQFSEYLSVEGLLIYPAALPDATVLTLLPGDDALVAYQKAFASAGPVIHIKGQVKTPIYLIHLHSGSDIPFQPIARITVERSGSATIEEVTISVGEGYAAGHMRTDITVEENATLHYIKYQDIRAEKYLVDTTNADISRNSRLHIYTCTFSGEIVRNNLKVIMNGEGAEAHLNGLYLLKGSTHCDNQTLVDHAVPNCYSNELYKGIIGDTATGVFNGKIIVRPDAQKTNAFQSNRNILTSEGANIYTKPQLEIFADDVKCSHGATSSRLDSKETFYLQSRGISKQKAEAMLMLAFAAETLEGIQDKSVREKLENIISQHLEVNI